ncbi:hypothetical protein MVEN_01369500 [Mycena venus]|uniref:Uncharacterized protein n=1 Tax=Mycena venus TaxID=2733690 RepID=A0A8H7CSF6_9AGAR|nr:hypothetical protein MVEN_01369500 [Mycena venus]
MATENIPELVIREVTPDITIFSKPFARFGILPFGGRSTAVRLSTGDVWVLASTPLTPDTKAAIDRLGPVGDGWGRSAPHVFWKEYPEAKVIGVEALIEKKQAEGLVLDGAYGKDAPDTKYGFEDEIYACYFSGFANKDVAWFHASSKTLIVADLLFNLPGNEQYSKSKTKAKVPIFGKLDPWGSVHKHFVWGQGKDKACVLLSFCPSYLGSVEVEVDFGFELSAMARDAKTVLGWKPERIIMCHGDVIETDATKAWASAYSKYLA